jgi:HAD superfamily hydrolase (TIGR01509 family)
MNSLTLFFDMGGTLVDSPDFFETVSSRLVGNPPDKKTCSIVMMTFGQIFRERNLYNPFLSVEGLLAKTLSILAAEHGYRDISSQAHDLVFEIYLHKSSLFPEVIPVLEALLKNKAQMIIASDADAALITEEIQKFHLEKYFIDRCVSDSVKAYKPAAGFTGYLKKYTAGNQNNCYFVGDSQVDMESARNLGIKSVLVNRNRSGQDLKADNVINDLAGLLPVLG